MRCSDCEILISALADGELHGRDRGQLEKHLADCETCRKVYEDTRVLQSDLSTALLECDDVPDLVTAVIDKVTPRRRITFRWAWAAVAATLLVIFLMRALLVGRQPMPRIAVVPQTKHGRVIAQEQGGKTARAAQHVTVKQSTIHIVTGNVYPKRNSEPLRLARVKPSILPAPISIDQGKIAVEYVNDGMSSADTVTAAAGSGSAPMLPPECRTGGRVTAMKETVLEDGKQIERLSYRINMRPAD